MKSTAFTLPALFGLLTLAIVGWTLSYKPDVNPPYPLPTDSVPYKIPVMAFEFAQKNEEIRLLFTIPQSKPTKADTAFVEKMRGLTQIDYLFIIAYMLFAVFFAMRAAQLNPTIWNRLAIVMALLVGLFDVLENGYLLQILSDVEKNSQADFQPILYKLHIIAWIKWEFSGVLMLLLTPFLWQSGYVAKMLSIFAIVVALMGITALLFNTPTNAERFASFVICALLGLIIYTLLRAITERIRPIPVWL